MRRTGTAEVPLVASVVTAYEFRRSTNTCPTAGQLCASTSVDTRWKSRLGRHHHDKYLERDDESWNSLTGVSRWGHHLGSRTSLRSPTYPRLISIPSTRFGLTTKKSQKQDIAASISVATLERGRGLYGGRTETVLRTPPGARDLSGRSSQYARAGDGHSPVTLGPTYSGPAAHHA
jgi:hypothetical protein